MRYYFHRSVVLHSLQSYVKSLKYEIWDSSNNICITTKASIFNLVKVVEKELIAVLNVQIQIIKTRQVI